MQPLLNKRVLVIDDEPTIRDLVAEALHEAGFLIETASNGVEALAIMQERVPDAIVLDLMMPRLDGTGFVELMRLNPRLASIPVLLVTAAYGADKAAQDVGAAAWLSKPFELGRLVAAVSQLAGSPAALPDLDGASRPLGPGSLPQPDV